MPDLNEQMRADPRNTESENLDAIERLTGKYVEKIEATEAARRQHGSAAQAVGYVSDATAECIKSGECCGAAIYPEPRDGWSQPIYLTAPPVAAEQPAAEKVPCHACNGTGGQLMEGDCSDCNGKGFTWDVAEQPAAAGNALTDDDIEEFAERMEASDPKDSFWKEFARMVEQHVCAEPHPAIVAHLERHIDQLKAQLADALAAMQQAASNQQEGA